MFYYNSEKSPFGNNFCIDQYRVVEGLNNFPILDLPEWIVSYLTSLECITIPKPQTSEITVVTENEGVDKKEALDEEVPVVAKKSRKSAV